MIYCYQGQESDWRELYPYLLRDSSTWNIPDERSFIEQYRQENIQHLLIGMENGEICGCSWLSNLRPGLDAYINYFLHRRHSIWKYMPLMREILKRYFKEYGLITIKGEIWADNRGSMAIAKRLGFKRVASNNNESYEYEVSNGIFIS